MKLKLLNAFIADVILITFFSAALFMLFGISPCITAPVTILASFIAPVPKNVAANTVYRSVWLRQIISYITSKDSAPWLLTGLNDLSSQVATMGDEAQAITLASLGVLPDVLIDNTDYPIDEQDLPLDPIVVALNKYQTKVTPITDDELFALSVDKMAAVIERHGTAIRTAKFGKAAWNIAPSGETADMPVLVTTGDDDGTGRKKLTWDDVSDFRRKIRKLDWPIDQTWRWVFCPDHESDLIVSDQRFVNQFYNRTDGKLFNQLGFEFHSCQNAPYYNPDTKARKSYGSAPDEGDQQASFIFLPSRAAIATGWTKMYWKRAENEPTTQKNTINFRHHFIATPLENAWRGAVVSNNAV